MPAGLRLPAAIFADSGKTTLDVHNLMGRLVQAPSDELVAAAEAMSALGPACAVTLAEVCQQVLAKHVHRDMAPQLCARMACAVAEVGLGRWSRGVGDKSVGAFRLINVWSGRGWETRAQAPSGWFLCLVPSCIGFFYLESPCWQHHMHSPSAPCAPRAPVEQGHRVGVGFVCSSTVEGVATKEGAKQSKAQAHPATAKEAMASSCIRNSMDGNLHSCACH